MEFPCRGPEPDAGGAGQREDARRMVAAVYTALAGWSLEIAGEDEALTGCLAVHVAAFRNGG